ncbi:MAG: CRTAC1 family protein [Gammaproteobacteria bacterium]|nr:CRTAC1 family protein [Gammaproteobacteria bacterium]
MSINVSKIPTFATIPIPFTHDYKHLRALPFIGGAVIDIDNNGKPEIFIGGGALQGDGLFTYIDNSFINIYSESGITKKAGDATYGAAAIDADYNGFTDLFVARDSGLYFLRNQNGVFVSEKIDVAFDDNSVPTAIALGDINLDGKVDLFISTNMHPKNYFKHRHAFNDTEYAATSLLLLNNGDNTFRDITTAAGLRDKHNVLTASFVDLDNDNWPDLVINQDAGQVLTYRNNHDLTFEQKPNPTQDFYGYPMGLALGDIDNNGFVDILVTNIGTMSLPYLSRGDLRDSQSYHPQWVFLHNDGDFHFTNTADALKLANYEFGWGAVMADFNSDSLQDIVVASNYMSFPPHWAYKQPGRLLVQTDNDMFAAVEKAAGINNQRYGISPLIADVNADGYTDIIFLNFDGTSQAFINSGGFDSNQISLPIPTTPDYLNMRVMVEKNNGRIIHQQFLVNQGLTASQAWTMNLGLGVQTAASRLEITQTNGRVRSYEKPPINQYFAFAGTPVTVEERLIAPPPAQAPLPPRAFISGPSALEARKNIPVPPAKSVSPTNENPPTPEPVSTPSAAPAAIIDAPPVLPAPLPASDLGTLPPEASAP